jgi:6-phosphogluconolactonase
MKVHCLAGVLALMLGTIGCSSSNHFLYVVGPGTNSVFGFQVSSSGAITPLSSAFSTDSTPVSVVVHPSGKFTYVANFNGQNISVFARDSGKGVLNTDKDPTTSNVLGPFAVTGNPVALAMNPNGQFLYVLNQGTSTNISAFSVDKTSGNLTAIGSPFSASAGSVSITVAANSKFLYVANPTQGTVSGFVIGSDGSLTGMQGSPFSVGTAPVFVTVDPQAKFLYVADQTANQILAFTLDQNTGAPSPISGSPFAAGSKPVSLAIDSTGVLLLAANQGSNSLSAYSVNTGTGVLSPVSGSPFTTGTAPVFVIVDSTNSFVYVADSGSNDIVAFVLSNGTLKSVSGSPFNITNSPAWLASR